MERFMYQFEGFSDGDYVQVNKDGKVLVGRLGWIIFGWDAPEERCAQATLYLDNGKCTLIESGPDAWNIFKFDSMVRRINISV